MKKSEDVVRISTLGLDWDLGFVTYEPTDPNLCAVGPDGRRIGVFLLHGGDGDFRIVEPLSLLLSKHYGYKVLAGTFPGRFYFPNPSRRWPGDTILSDHEVRTPIWKQGELITPDQYDIITDDSMREIGGYRTVARAKPETPFYERMAAWPAAFEEGMIEGSRRHLPASDYAIYGQGHSTGGPFVSMLSQRIENMVGVVATEHSPFGAFVAKSYDWAYMHAKDASASVEDNASAFERARRRAQPHVHRTDPFNELFIRTWRDEARYMGPEALGQEGALALMQLAALMEDVHERWESVKHYPQFKAEYMVTHAIEDSLSAAANAAAKRLRLGKEESRDLVERYLDYTRPKMDGLSKPLPNFLFSIARHSRSHSPEKYREVFLPCFAAVEPAPRVDLVQFDVGGHSFWKPLPGLPLGIAPAVTDLWDAAIRNGYFVQ